MLIWNFTVKTAAVFSWENREIEKKKNKRCWKTHIHFNVYNRLNNRVWGSWIPSWIFFLLRKISNLSVNVLIKIYYNEICFNHLCTNLQYFNKETHCLCGSHVSKSIPASRRENNSNVQTFWIVCTFKKSKHKTSQHQFLEGNI